MVDNWAGQTMRFGLIGRAHVVLHRDAAPDPAEWDAYMKSLAASLPMIKCVFVYTRGGGPNPKQRKQITDLYQSRPPQPTVAVITPSTIVRAVVTAVNLFAPKPLKMFSSTQLGEAFSFLGLDSRDGAEILGTLETHKAWLG